MAEAKIFTPDFSAKGTLLAGSKYADKNVYGGQGTSGKDIADTMGKAGKTYAANIDELKKKIKERREQDEGFDIEEIEIEEDEEVLDEEEDARIMEELGHTGQKHVGSQGGHGGEWVDDVPGDIAQNVSSAVKKTSSPWRKTSSVMKKYVPGNPEEQIIRDSFGWGSRKRAERGADLGRYIYDSTIPIVKELGEKFNSAQYTEESTHSVIGELSEMSNAIQTFKGLVGEASDIDAKNLWARKSMTTEDMHDIDNIVGQEPGMLEMDFDENNQMRLRVAQLDGGYKSISLTEFSDKIKNNLQPAAKKQAHFEMLANLRQLGIDGKPLPENLVEMKLGQITPQNIAALIKENWAGLQSFEEEAEHDPEIRDLNISAKEVYDHVLENIDNPENFESARQKVAEWWAAKEEEAYYKGVDIKNKKDEELRRSFSATGAGSGMGGVHREESGSPLNKKTEGMTTSQKIQYYKNL